MAGRYSQNQVLALARGQRANLEQALQAAAQARSQHAATRAAVETSYLQALNDLAHSILPTLTPESVQSAAALAGFPLWQSQSPVAAREAERAALTREIQRIENEPAFRDRELLRHPHTGTLTSQAAELEDLRRPWAEVAQKCDHPRFERLLETGYGTPSYAVGFWRMSYYEDWKAGDEVLERFPGKSFSDVASDFRRAQETLATLNADLARVQAEIAAGENLERAHAAALQALADLDVKYLLAAQRTMVEHIMTSAPSIMTALLQRNLEIHGLYLRASGLGAKRAYLDGLAQEYIEKFDSQGRADLQRLDGEIAKYSRPKCATMLFPADKIDRRYRDRSAAYQKHWKRYDSTYRTVYVYDDYTRVSTLEDWLWWDIMTDQRYPDLPEIREYREAHGDYRYVPGGGDPDAAFETAAAAAQIDADLASGGGGLFADAS